jgi:hypothetical protein
MAVTITSKKDGFRRCGAAHGKVPVTYPDGRWSAGDLKVMRAEPLLSVVITKDETAENTRKKGKKE